MYCPKCGEEMDDKNSTGGHICYRTVSVRAVSIINYEQLRTEIKRLQTIIDNRAEDLEVKAKYEIVQAEIKELKKALKRYGRHIDCDSNAILVESKGKGKGWYPAPCSCGFAQALKE